LSVMAIYRQLRAVNVMVRLHRFLGGKRFMRNAICLLVALCGSWSSGFGQSAPKFTSPRIVATFERLGLTAELPPTTIYTPKNWGTFRISVVLVLVKTNRIGNSYWLGVPRFTNAAGKNVTCYCAGAFLYTDLPDTSGAEFPFRAEAGVPIKFTVTSTGNTSGSSYNVWVVVEQLM
jgi:hypothetical protein